MNTRNTENKFFTTLFATFAVLMLASFVTTDGHTKNYKQEVQQEVQVVKPVVKEEVIQPMATVYVVGKRLPKTAS
jgi:hypothetical protein